MIGSTTMGSAEGFAAPVISSAPDMAQAKWYAAYTWSHHEKSVARQLDERRIESFVPLYRSVRRWKDRRKELQLALFPSYVFVRIDMKQRVSVLQVPGVVSFVSFGGLPAPLPDCAMENLRNGLNQQACAQPHPYMAAGRRVQIVNGPFCGIEGILVRRKEKLRVILSIALIKRAVAIEVDESDIAPIS